MHANLGKCIVGTYYHYYICSQDSFRCKEKEYSIETSTDLTSVEVLQATCVGLVVIQIPYQRVS